MTESMAVQPQVSLVDSLDAGLSQDVDCRQMFSISEEGDCAAVSKLSWLGTDGEGSGRFLITKRLGALPHEQEQALLKVSRSAMVAKKSVKQRLTQMLAVNSKTWHGYVQKAETYQRLQGGGNAAVANEIGEVAQAAHAAGTMATRASAVASEVKAGQEVLQGTVSNLQDELTALRRAQDSQEGKMPAAVAAAAAELHERMAESFLDGRLRCELCTDKWEEAHVRACMSAC